MKFVRFEYQEKICHGQLVVDFIQLWSGLPWEAGKELDEWVHSNDVRLLAPCIPRKIVALAINYPGVTGLNSANEEPLVFLKASTSVIGDKGIIKSPFPELSVWGEPELAIVIGKRLSKGTVAEAIEAVFGYTIANDVTCHNVSGWDHHLARSKSPDTFCAMGPWIDTSFVPGRKLIQGYQNNRLIRNGSVDQRLWSEPELLVWLSGWMTLEPGDVVLTGTPTRVCERVFLRPGDSYVCVIEGLGVLTNSFEGVAVD